MYSNFSPPVAPSDRPSVRVTIALPSDRTATDQRPSSPTRIDNTVTAVSRPVSRALVTHGDNPAARASESRQTSPPTMQMPVRTPATTRSPTPGTATAAPTASTATTTSSTAA